MPEQSLELLLQDPILVIYFKDQVKSKINNNSKNNIERIVNKNQQSISLQYIPNNLKALYSFATIQNRKGSDITHDRFSYGTKITVAHIRGLQSNLPWNMDQVKQQATQEPKLEANLVMSRMIKAQMN